MKYHWTREEDADGTLHVCKDEDGAFVGCVREFPEYNSWRATVRQGFHNYHATFEAAQADVETAPKRTWRVAA